ncbi:MAG TPA: D-2-hydroxyacid dehydrogenase family protein [Burkholderiaceae bacterium]|nr:D-2-hydroxyacid dehydrogenase family protein [Burkholderiaceae bacterium]
MAERPCIVVLDDYEHALRRLADWREVDALAEVREYHEPLRGAALMSALAEADALVLMRDRTPLDAAAIERLPRLRFVMHTGSRNRALDAQALAARGIPVQNTDWGPSKESTCEHAWALILAAVKQLERQMQLMRRGAWRDSGAPLPGVLGGDRLGVVGLGEIGKRVARVGQAFGMELVTWSPHMTPERAAEAGAASVSLAELLATSRVVSLHLVPSADTRHLINAQRLATMRRDAILVNTSRAALVDGEALASSLAAGRPGMAALDVYDNEPLPAEHPLRRLPNAVLTPHMGFVAEPVFQQFADEVVAKLLTWLRGDPANAASA